MVVMVETLFLGVFDIVYISGCVDTVNVTFSTSRHHCFFSRRQLCPLWFPHHLIIPSFGLQQHLFSHALSKWHKVFSRQPKLVKVDRHILMPELIKRSPGWESLGLFLSRDCIYIRSPSPSRHKFVSICRIVNQERRLDPEYELTSWEKDICCHDGCICLCLTS